MKKNLSLFVISGMLVAFTSSASAQGAYLKARVGYGTSASSEWVGLNTNNSGSSFTSEAVYGSYGKGLNAGASVGMMFNENVGAELGLGYLLGGTIKSTDTDTSGTTETTSKASMINIAPSVVVAMGGNVSPYARLGILLGLGGKVSEQATSGGTTAWEDEYSGGIAIGFTSAFGVSFSSGGKVGFFTELAVNSISWSPTTLKTTTPSGVPDEKLVKSTSSSATNESIAPKIPFSSVGVAVGLKISFGG